MQFKSFVTGATGFIGINLVNELIKRGHKVFILVKPDSDLNKLKDIIQKIRIYRGNIFDKDFISFIIKDISPDYVFHLAQYGGNKNEKNHDLIKKVIIDGTDYLYNACAGINNCRAIIHTGTSSEYGYKSEPMREDMTLEPNLEYGVAKSWATLYGQYKARQNSLPVTTLRIFSAFGPYEKGDRLIPVTIKAFLKNGILNMAQPSTVRDFVYVEDVVEAIIMAAEKSNPGEIFNIGTGRQISLRQVVDTVTKFIDGRPKIKWGSFNKRSLDTTFWLADTKHSSSVLGWKSLHSFEDGIKKTIDWFKKNINLYGQQTH